MNNSINWNRYEGFDGGVNRYEVYRTMNGVFSESPVATLINEDDNNEYYSFEEQLDSLNANIQSDLLSDYTNGAICYKVVAFENNQNQYGFIDSSFSNVFCLNYRPLVFIPNAFTPEGQNPTFIPVITNVSENNYSLTIVNRWGQEFFQTNDVLEGWDGTVSLTNREAPNDIYVYLLEFEDQNGNKYFKKGMVSLLR